MTGNMIAIQFKKIRGLCRWLAVIGNDARNRAVWIGFGGEKVAELGSGNDVEVNLRVD